MKQAGILQDLNKRYFSNYSQEDPKNHNEERFFF